MTSNTTNITDYIQTWLDTPGIAMKLVPFAAFMYFMRGSQAILALFGNSLVIGKVNIF